MPYSILFQTKMIEIKEIENIIAQDMWSYKAADGKTVTCKIIVGSPFLIPEDENHDWVCPVWIEGFTPRIVPAFGVGPVDSLMNAMTLVKQFFEKHKDNFTSDFSNQGT
jgi:hypothetical protein